MLLRNPGYRMIPYETTFSLVLPSKKNAIGKVGLSYFLYRSTCAYFSAVIKQCALERDLELFEAGDVTEVGERGLTLRQVHGSNWV